MSEEFKRNVFITTSHEAYQHFLSDDWAERTDALARPAEKLYPLVFDLILELRAAAYTASLPLSIVEHLKAYHDAFVNGDRINTALLDLAENVPALLAHEFPQLTCNPADIRAIRTRLVELGAQFLEKRQKTKVEFPLKDTWDDYLKDHVFQLMLWGSQKICYVSIYNSYEYFVVHAIKAALKLESCRSNDGSFKRQFVEVFGEALRDKCWTNDKLKIVREIRHSLSHAAGRITKQLAPLAHGFEIRDERIQVTPEKTKELLSLVKDCVTVLVEKAVTLPQFV